MDKLRQQNKKRTTDFTVVSVTACVQLTKKDWDKLVTDKNGEWLRFNHDIGSKMKKAGATEFDYCRTYGHVIDGSERGQLVYVGAESHARVSELISIFFTLLDDY